MPDSINQTLPFFIKSSLTNKMLLGNGNKKSLFKYFYYPDPTASLATPLTPITPRAPSREGSTTTFEL